MVDDMRVAERKLESMLMEVSGLRNDLAAYHNKGDASGVERCELALKLNYSRIRVHCAEHDLELPHDVPTGGEE